MQSDGPVVARGRISPTTNEAVATTVMPIRDETGRFLGVVATNIRLQSLSDSLWAIAAEYQDHDSFSVLIIDSAGQIIADPDPDHLLAQAATEIPKIAQRKISDKLCD